MKPFGIIAIVAIVLLAGGIFMSRSAQDNDPSVISANGIHWHPELKIFIDGEEQSIPANIGLIGGHSPMHTHEPDGVIHLEYEGGIVREDDIRLGKFFELWGKEFSSEQIFEHKGDVKMFVNGEENSEFGNYMMQDKDQIEIRLD